MRALARLLVPALLGAGVGCSLLVAPPPAAQCTTDSDCDAVSALRGGRCLSGVCNLNEPRQDDGGQPICSDSALCTSQQSGRITVCPTPGASSCVRWQQAPCELWKGDILNPNAVVIGTILPFTTKQIDGTTRKVPYADRLRQAIDLGIEDFDAKVPGGAFALGDMKQRPLAVIHCDSQFDEGGARAAFNHLVTAVGVKAMIVGSDDDLASISPLAQQNGIAIACSDCVADLPPGPLAWRVGPRIGLEAPMVARRVQDLEQVIKAGPNPPAEIKVTVLQAAGRPAEALVNALMPLLFFNGKNGMSQSAGKLTFVLAPNPLKETVQPLDVAAKIVAGGRPDIVVVAMSDDFPQVFLRAIEGQWAAGDRKPFYVTTAYNLNETSFVGVLPSNADLRRRISGSRPAYAASLKTNIDDFEARYRRRNGTWPDGNWTGFEATYALGLAVLAARSQPVLDGPHISIGFERLVGGPIPIELRLDKLSEAIGLMATQTGKIDIHGLLSGLDWNISTRDFDNDVGTYCFLMDDQGNLVIKQDAGLHYATSTKTFSGSFACE